jgi:hypothetical protein
MHLFEISGPADATELFDFQWLAHPGASSIFCDPNTVRAADCS